MSSIVAFGSYVPVYRLTRGEIARARGGSAGDGGPARGPVRSVAAFDEDTLTMGVEAARAALAAAGGGASVRNLIFCTSTPPYAVKNNASALHAVLGLPERTYAYDLGGAYRSVAGALRAGADGSAGTLLVASDLAVTLPGDGEELEHADAAAAVLFGPAEPALAELVGSAGTTAEFYDRWRDPAEAIGAASEERFATDQYLALLERTLAALPVTRADHVVVAAAGSRTTSAARKALTAVGTPVELAIGHGGCADPLLRLNDALQRADAGETVLLVVLADGCDVFLWRRTERPLPPGPAVADLVGSGRGANYLDVLNWRGLLGRAGPRRPAPAVISVPASARNAAWKYAMVAGRCTSCGTVCAPPQRVCVRCGAVDSTDPVDLASVGATVRTFSVDRLAYSPNPPVVAAVADFDGGGRLEVELADVDPSRLAVGARLRMVLRRRHSSGGLHNYTWKAVLLREERSHG